MSQVLDESLEAGRDAFRRHSWREAYDLLKEADQASPLSAPDLEQVGEAAWWSGNLEECIDYHERSYNGHLQDGNPRRAGYMALVLVRHHSSKNNSAVAMGWFNHAERLLQDEPECIEQGYLAQIRTIMLSEMGELNQALEQATLALDLGTKFGDRTLQAYALLDVGRVRVARGEVVDGLKHLDEATVAAVSGEVAPIAAGIIYCRAISSCAELADWRRAGEFTEAARRWCNRLSIAGGFPGICRVHRAEIIRLRGEWAEAEQEARQASEELGSYMPSIGAEAFYEMGEIRLRMGDLPAAEEAFMQAHELMREPYPGLALLRLAEGKTEAALKAITGALGGASTRLGRAKLLPAQVMIAIAAGDLGLARAGAEELASIAEDFGSAALRACAECARGQLLVAEGDPAGALEALRRALGHWKEVDAPYETAKVRISMAEAYRAIQDEDSAVVELRSARSAFERLGAALDARRVTEMMGDAAGNGRVKGGQVTKTFMFTDIVKSTNLVEAIGDEAWEDVQRWHDSTLRSLVAQHRGQEVKTIGDGFFVAFDDSSAAIECAVAIQRTLADHRKSHGFSPQVRIGLHSAEATQKGLDYAGMGVHEAARIGALAEGGEILVSSKTYESSRCRFPTSEARTVSLKGVSEQVEVVAITWR